ncbi:MAG TPA: hypothetical protein VFP21_06655 [Solirubrobacterales bacterium]|nr:hypothetical protein [Solirubrobacterales bacterium]
MAARGLSSVDLDEHQADQLAEGMAQAVKALEQVAAHLGLGGEARLAMTMSAFDAAPKDARGGLQARQVASSFKGSWPFAKGVAFGGERFKVSEAQQRKRKQELPAAPLSTRRQFAAIREWLNTKPEKNTKSAYAAWRETRNSELPEGAAPYPPPRQSSATGDGLRLRSSKPSARTQFPRTCWVQSKLGTPKY